ncbi:MAG: 1-(5-phosphoribosyl)-5-[(5-phosphoribosylamino)methylideneamino]imidazole-4-carboxamide isomerase, partial [SAR86 cluster bacterium]
MHIIPAIDFKDGKVVNLKQGRLEESTTYSDDPVGMADHWVSQGAERLHLVDLDGAFEGYPVNQALIAMIAANHPDLTIQLGGGIRSPEVIESYLNAGVDYVIIGTKAVKEPEFVSEMCKRFPGHIIVGLDAKDGRVATDGWAEVSEVMATDLARRFANDGVESIVYTDIARDGMMQGVNVEATAALARACGIPVIASGGVTNMDDLKRLGAVADQGIL